MLSAFKNFLITFVIGAVLFGVIGFFTTRYVGEIITGIIDGDDDVTGTIIHSPTETEKEKEPEVKPDPNLKVPEGDSFTFVVVGTDYRPEVYTDYYVTIDDFKEIIAKAEAEENKTPEGNKDLSGIKDKNKAPKDPVSVLTTDVRRIKATWIALVRADKEAREFVICYFSPETHVSAPCGDSTLGEVYGLYGIDILCQYMNAFTGLEVDYRFVLDGVNLESFYNSMGAVSFELDTDLYAGEKYHLSSSTTVIGGDDEDEEETSDKEDDTKDSESEKEPDENNDNKEKDKDKNKDKEVIQNVPVLDKGKQSLSTYNLNILNTFKELSQKDIDAKSGYILEMVTQYLKRCAGWSESDLTWKVKKLTEFEGEYDLLDPYAHKSILGTEFTSEEVAEIHSMIGAIEYFECKKFTYPGAYSQKKDVYEPDIKTGLETFKKYRTENDKKENN